MVELQIVILAVAGSSPVGHPDFHFRFPICEFAIGSNGAAWHVRCLRSRAMLVPESFVESRKAKLPRTDFWLRLLQDEELRDCDNLQKLLVGCEIIAALDGSVDLLAA